MAWEWVAPVCTASVGIVGIGATYWQGRAGRLATAAQAKEQRDHAVQERNRAEKREAYVAYLGATHRSRVAMIEIRQLLRRDGSVGEASAIRGAAIVDLEEQRQRLRLVASLRVRQLARLTALELRNVLKCEVRADPRPLDHQVFTALLAAMKEDLGYELAPVDLEALAAKEKEASGDEGAPSPVEDLDADSLRTERSG